MNSLNFVLSLPNQFTCKGKSLSCSSQWTLKSLELLYTNLSNNSFMLNDFNTLEHWLRTPNEAFFTLKSRNFGLGQTNWADKFWGNTITAHFVTVSPCFPLFHHYFSKKRNSLYINTPNIYLGLGFEFEFGLQRIWIECLENRKHSDQNFNRMYQCTECGEVFEKAARLKNHIVYGHQLKAKISYLKC